MIDPSCNEEVKGAYFYGGWRAELEGMWISKFNASVTTKDGYVYSKPTVNATTVGNSINKLTIIDLCMNIKNAIPQFKDDPKIDSHLMKESEMGVVGILAYSKYGNKEIKNKNNDLLCGGYNNLKQVWNDGKSSSSTNNAYGVYDLIGGTSGPGYIVSFWWANQGTGAVGKPNPLTGKSTGVDMINTEYISFSSDSRTILKGRKGGGAADLYNLIGTPIAEVNLNQGNPFVLMKGLGRAEDSIFAKLFRSGGGPSNGNGSYPDSYFRPVIVVEE